jgi:hypothetical protein
MRYAPPVLLVSSLAAALLVRSTTTTIHSFSHTEPSYCHDKS